MPDPTIDPEPWPAAEAAHLGREANMRLNEHTDPGHYRNRGDPRNCAACALHGTWMRQGPHEHPSAPPDHPNWLRIWLQLGKMIPSDWYAQALTQAERDDQTTYSAILRDIATFDLKLLEQPHERRLLEPWRTGLRAWFCRCAACGAPPLAPCRGPDEKNEARKAMDALRQRQFLKLLERAQRAEPSEPGV
jgi:hypothetical protein